jgi:serine/threonine protein kinase
MSLGPGDSFGQFRLLRELGKGATGTVFLAEQTTLGRECALKILAPELVRDKTFLERFRREGRIAASLRHAGIVRIFDLVECAEGFALAMDYIDGQELQELLTSKKKLPRDVALDIIGKILEALDYAHSKGVVHRDIKPANILLEPDGSVFLTDFSIARLAGGEKLTKTGTVIGTPEYMAPEQFDGKDVDSRVDVYATALILYEMLTGVNPFRGDTIAETIKKQIMTEPPPLQEQADVPEALAELVHKGLNKSPDNRFQTASEMNQALKALGKPVEASSGSLTQFLNSVELGAISMDDAVSARAKVKEAIDKSFKRQLTIVMLDLAGSSKIKIPNQTLIADRAFQDYRQTINKLLEAHGCERYEWSGDGAISLFPEPIGAVDAAVKVQRAVAGVGSRHDELPDALKVRIGIRTGLVYYDPRRTLGEFASRTVDQAGHLEKDCPPGLIRLGDTTVKAMSDRYAVKSLGENRDDIEVFEIGLEAIHGTGDTQDMPSPSPPPPKAEPVPARVAPSPAKPTPGQEKPRKAVRAKLPEPTISKESDETALFQPKDGPPTIERKPDEPEDESVWWGWRTLGLFFFLFFGVAALKAMGLNLPVRPANFIRGAFLMHLGLVPLYCIYQLFRNRESRAKEAAVAGGVFLVALLGTAALFSGAQ